MFTTIDPTTISIPTDTPTLILDDKPDSTPIQTLTQTLIVNLPFVLKVFRGSNPQIAVDSKAVRFPDAKPFIDINNCTQVSFEYCYFLSYFSAQT